MYGTCDQREEKVLVHVLGTTSSSRTINRVERKDLEMDPFIVQSQSQE